MLKAFTWTFDISGALHFPCAGGSTGGLLCARWAYCVINKSLFFSCHSTLMIIGYWLLAVGYWLFAIGYESSRIYIGFG